MMKQRAYGFTIVELLIVIVVIAILAAISVVAYVGVQNSAHDSAIKADLANFTKAAQMYHAERGAYPALSQLDQLGLRVTKNSYDTVGYNLYYCTNVGVGDKFGFAAKSKSGNNFYSGSAGSGPSGTSAMSGSHACGPIEVLLTGNITYGYNRAAEEWRTWAN